MTGTWIEFWGIDKEIKTVVDSTVPQLNSYVNVRKKNGKWRLMKVVHIQYVLDVNEYIAYKVKVVLR